MTSLNPVGAAANDGRIKVGDRILKVDGHSLRGLENMEAASVLRNCGNPVRLVLCRKRLPQENGEPAQGEGEWMCYVCVCECKPVIDRDGDRGERKREEMLPGGLLLLTIFIRCNWCCVSTICNPQAL